MVDHRVGKGRPVIPVPHAAPLVGYYITTSGDVWSFLRKGKESKYYPDYSRPPRLMKQYVNQDGYWTIGLSFRGRSRPMLIHRLVLLAYRGNPGEGEEACHGPNGPRDNSLSNLSWGTKEKNLGDDKRRDGTMQRGERHGKARLTEARVRFCRAARKRGRTYHSLAKRFGVGLAAIAKACLPPDHKDATWTHVR